MSTDPASVAGPADLPNRPGEPPPVDLHPKDNGSRLLRRGSTPSTGESFSGGMWIMGVEVKADDRIETLQALLELLGAPDLTLAEAKPLRDRLFTLLGRDERASAADADRSSSTAARTTGGRSGHKVGSPHLRLCKIC